MGELVGAMAVVATLIYLAAQVRENTQAARRETASRVMDTVMRTQGRVIEDGELAKLVSKGRRDLSGLEHDERLRMKLFYFEILRNAEEAVYQNELGALDDDILDKWADSLGDMLATWPTLATYWVEHRERFRPTFQNFVDARLLESG